MSLTARALEEAGVTTVIVGSARDIVEECGVPRFVFSDVPLGNPFGPPDDAATQVATLELALDVAERSPWARTTVQAPYAWPSDDWRAQYMRVDESNRAALAAAGDSRRRRQAEVKAERTG